VLLQDQLKRYKDFFSEFLNILFTIPIRFPWIPVFLTIGIVLRITGFRTAFIWYDEMFSLEMTRQGLLEMIQSLKTNISPPGWEISLWFLTRVFGWNDFSLRILSILAGIAILILVYRISLILKFTREQQIASLALIAILPYQILVTQQGRVYAIFALLYLLGIYGLVSGRWILLGISISGMLWSHNISFLFIPGLILAGINTNYRNWKKLLSIVGIASATYLPWVSETIRHVGLSAPWFKPITVVSFFVQLYEVFFAWGFPNGYAFITVAFYWLISLIVTALIISSTLWSVKSLQVLTQTISRFFKKNSGMQHNHVSTLHHFQNSPNAQQTLLLAFGIPFLLLFATSILVRNVFFNRTIYPLTIPLIMWLVLFYGKPYSNKVHMLIWIISILFITGILPYWTPSQIGQSGIQDLKNVISASSTSSQKDLREDVIIYHNTGLSALIFNYYFPSYKNYLIDGNNVLGAIDLHIAKTRMKRITPEELPRQKTWVVWTRYSDLEIINRVADKRFRDLVNKYDCPLVTIIPYPNSWDFYVYLCDLEDR
jgi:hypothetical protein